MVKWYVRLDLRSDEVMYLLKVVLHEKCLFTMIHHGRISIQNT